MLNIHAKPIPDFVFVCFHFKGRARAANSKYYMLVDFDIAGTFKDDLRIFKGIEMVWVYLDI